MLVVEVEPQDPEEGVHRGLGERGWEGDRPTDQERLVHMVGDRWRMVNGKWLAISWFWWLVLNVVGYSGYSGWL